MEHFPFGLTPLAVLASPAQGEVEQEEFVEDHVEAEEIVEQLAFVALDSVIAFAALGQPFVVKLVVVVVKFDIPDEPSDCFVGQLLDIGVVVGQFVLEIGVTASQVVQPTFMQAAVAKID